jgi:hypothetical protein
MEQRRWGTVFVARMVEEQLILVRIKVVIHTVAAVKID